MSAPAIPPTPGEPRTLRAVAIVPARLGSTRLPRKMLLRETGRPLFEHTARNLERCDAIERVVVATDSREILDAARAAGIEALSTSASHPSGTDRVDEAARSLAERGERFDVVVDVQGDEPDVDPSDLARLVACFSDPAVEVATLASNIESEEEARSPSVVKVVLDARGDALYFSRSLVPNRAHARPGARTDPPWRRHVGVYAFRPAALERFAALAPSELEELESLEQLRWLEAGGKMRVVEATHVPRGIDTRADYDAFVARCAAGEGDASGAAQRSSMRDTDKKGWVRA